MAQQNEIPFANKTTEKVPMEVSDGGSGDSKVSTGTVVVPKSRPVPTQPKPKTRASATATAIQPAPAVRQQKNFRRVDSSPSTSFHSELDFLSCFRHYIPSHSRSTFDLCRIRLGIYHNEMIDDIENKLDLELPQYKVSTDLPSDFLSHF